MADPFAPVILPGWPKVSDNMSWSEDHLAVASGEAVHILTPRTHIKPPVSDSAYWHVESIRVNQFSEQEWPLVDLAALSDLSLGEEQSTPSVCSLSWSPVSIGLHRRSVLAVLTTNHLLALWESTGIPGSWKRTCIVNKLMTMEGLMSNRRKQRLRAVAWLPGLAVEPFTRQEQQHLIIVDDDDRVSVFNLAKGAPSHDGNWHLKLAYSHQLPREKTSALQRKSLLQRALLTSPVTQIQPGRWQKMDESGSSGILRIVVSFTRGAAGLACPKLAISCKAQQEGWHFEGHNGDRDTLALGVSARPSEAIEAALAKPKSEFDQQFSLQGHVRVQQWGTVQCPDGRSEAACVTFHPSDMVEHNIPSLERCTVLFAPMLATEGGVETHTFHNDARQEILQWLAANASIDSNMTDVDLKIVRVAAACVYTAFSNDAGLMAWSRAAAELASSFEIATDADDGGDTPVEGASRFVPATVSEPCEMCNAAISISQDLRSGRCSQGHTFARCGISFLAIQEPGISKYCSRCGKEFLDLAKLEPHEGPSLSHALLEEFDVCPYCRGKFRG